MNSQIYKPLFQIYEGTKMDNEDIRRQQRDDSKLRSSAIGIAEHLESLAKTLRDTVYPNAAYTGVPIHNVSSVAKYAAKHCQEQLAEILVKVSNL